MSKEKYIGYGKLLDLPSGRVGLELTVNDLKYLTEELHAMTFGSKKNFKILVLPVKEHNVTEWRTHSVKIGESKYNKKLIDEH